MLQSWLRGCWTAVGCGCCVPGETDSERWGKDQRAVAQQVQCEPGFCRQPLNTWTAALLTLRRKGESFFVLSLLLFLSCVGS